MRANHFEMRKVDLCSVTEGTEVILATSSDEKHPPENIIDGNPETFWTTTGMFPQEFIICFHKHVKIEKLVIQSYLVRTLRIEKTTSKEPLDFEQWVEKDLVHTEGLRFLWDSKQEARTAPVVQQVPCDSVTHFSVLQECQAWLTGASLSQLCVQTQCPQPR